MTKKKYEWCEERGIVYAKEDRQAIQLLAGPATYLFRRQCGKLLVDALNAARKQKRPK